MLLLALYKFSFIYPVTFTLTSSIDPLPLYLMLQPSTVNSTWVGGILSIVFLKLTQNLKPLTNRGLMHTTTQVRILVPVIATAAALSSTAALNSSRVDSFIHIIAYALWIGSNVW